MTATKRWLRRNRTGFAIGVGVVGVGYIAGQYVLSKFVEMRERMAGDRLAKEEYKLLALVPDTALTEQLAATIPTESGRLYYHCPRVTTYCVREYHQSFTIRKDYTTIAAEKGREIG